MYSSILCIIQQGIVPHRVVPHLHGFSRCLLLQYQFHSKINKHMVVACSFSFLHAPVHLLAMRIFLQANYLAM